MRPQDRKKLQRKQIQWMHDWVSRRPVCGYWRRFQLRLALALEEHDSRRYLDRPTTYESHNASQPFLLVDRPFGKQLPFNRETLRLEGHEFQHLLSLVANHPAFQGAHEGRKQATIDVQVGVFLSRLADDGLTVAKCAKDWGVAKGSVTNFSIRAADAIASLVEQVIVWPRGKYKRALKYEIWNIYGIPNCIGFIDGVHIPLAKRPAMTDESARCYWTRKKRYSLLVVAACDHTMRFVYARVGWSGSSSDARVQNESELCTSPTALFRHGEHFVGDAGFRATKYITPMYKAVEEGGPKGYQFNFNRLATPARVAIEHAFGMLKGRWRALKNLDVRLRKGWLEHALVWNVVVAGMVLHNLFIDTFDEYRPSKRDWRAGRALEKQWKDEMPSQYDVTPFYNPKYPEHLHREQVAYLMAKYDHRVPSADFKLWFPTRPEGLLPQDDVQPRP